MPVPPGTMRNTWFPKKMAEYQTLAQLKEVGDIVVERAATFDPREIERLAQEKEEREVREARKKDKKEALMDPNLDEIEDTFGAPIEAAVPIEPEGSIEPEIMSVRSPPLR